MALFTGSAPRRRPARRRSGLREPVYQALVLLGRGVFRVLGLRREVRHPERLDLPGGAVLAITHFGYLDFALAEWAVHRQTGRLTRFLVTARAFEHPLAGRLLRAMRHIPVERRAGADAYRHAVAALHAGELVGVFPEGRVNHDDVGPLKSGAVRMAAQAGVPIVPVVVWGGQQVLTKGVRFGLRRARRAKVTILVGRPSHPDPSGRLDVEAATMELRGRLQALVREAKNGDTESGQANGGHGDNREAENIER